MAKNINIVFNDGFPGWNGETPNTPRPGWAIEEYMHQLIESGAVVKGITGLTYEPLFGGEFTVTTATDAEHEHPYANPGILGSLNKRYAYRITFDGEQYVLSPQIFATELDNTWMPYAYVGDISLYYRPLDGLLNEPQNVPFLITEHAEHNGGNPYVVVYTSVAGEHTILIEGVDAAYDVIPSDLVYGDVYPPFQYTKTWPQRQGVSFGSNRLITTSHRPPMYAFGCDNVVSGQGACAIGVMNEASGQAAMAFGYGNKASGDFSHVIGCRNIAAQSRSHAEGQRTIASGGIDHVEGDGSRSAALAAHVEGGGTYADASQAFIHISGVNNAISTETGKTVTITKYNEDGTVYNTSTRNLGKYAEVIGNGDSDQARSNARTLDWDGNEELAGGLTLGLGTADEVHITPAQLKALLALLA